MCFTSGATLFLPQQGSRVSLLNSWEAQSLTWLKLIMTTVRAGNYTNKEIKKRYFLCLSHFIQICGVCFHFQQFMVLRKTENCKDNTDDSTKEPNQANWGTGKEVRGDQLGVIIFFSTTVYLQIGITDPLDAAAGGIGSGAMEKWKNTARSLLHWRKTLAFLCFFPLLILGKCKC